MQCVGNYGRVLAVTESRHVSSRDTFSLVSVSTDS